WPLCYGDWNSADVHNNNMGTETFREHSPFEPKIGFTGRHREQNRWRHFILPENLRPLWFIVGPAGIGKTTLLQTFRQDLLPTAGQPLYLDAHYIPPYPTVLSSAIAQTAKDRDLESYCNQTATPVLLIDSFECLQAIES